MTIVHQSTSLEWFKKLRDHLAGVDTLGEAGNTETNAGRHVAKIFAEIVRPETDEALLFSPAAVLGATMAVPSVVQNKGKRQASPREEILPEKLGTDWVKIKVRKRLTDDGGRSMMAV